MSKMMFWKVSYVWSFTLVFGDDMARSPPAGTYPYEPTTEVALPKHTSFNRMTFRIHNEKGTFKLCGVRVDSESGKYSDI